MSASSDQSAKYRATTNVVPVRISHVSPCITSDFDPDIIMHKNRSNNNLHLIGKRRPNDAQGAVRRKLPPITPEDDARIDAMITALREPSQTFDPSTHPALQVLADAGIRAILGPLRVKVSDLPDAIAAALVPSRASKRADWSEANDRQILREFNEERRSFQEIADLHKRTRHFIRSRLDELGANRLVGIKV